MVLHRRQRKKELKLLEKESCSESQAESQAETAEIQSADDLQVMKPESSPAAESESSVRDKDVDDADEPDEQSKEELELLAAMGWQCQVYKSCCCFERRML